MSASIASVSKPLPRVGINALKHIPGEAGPPVVGTTMAQLKDHIGFSRAMHERHGAVFWSNSFGHPAVTLVGADANELVMMDKDKIFSSELGWEPMMGHVFKNGLMLMDFDDHRKHRRALGVAFKSNAMKSYLDQLNQGTKSALATWPHEISFYAQIKQLTLDLAATSFLGISLGQEAQEINKAFIDMVAAITAVIRAPLPGTVMARGLKGRRRMEQFFLAEIPKRRGATGDDMLTLICNEASVDGEPLRDDEIVSHMIFLMMAAHDTTTSSITAMIEQLIDHPDWQERLRQEALSLDAPEDGLRHDDLAKLDLHEYVFKEAMRLHAPIPTILRRAVEPFHFGGFDIPAGTIVVINPSYTHLMEDYWEAPLDFDPMRFSPENVAARHKFAWFPFSGGAHMCLGLHFAYMQMKVFFVSLVARLSDRKDYSKFKGLADITDPETKRWPPNINAPARTRIAKSATTPVCP
jgi:cytochrome P450